MSIFEELEKDVSIDEILNAIKYLKRGKSRGEDGILNECLIEHRELFLPIFVKLFNNILDSGFFPSRGSKGVVIPIFKKGDNLCSNDYRGISVVIPIFKKGIIYVLMIIEELV
jgi:hypothetical protein